VKPKDIRENLNMSQQEFSRAYGILSTLRNWEQGRRKLDNTTIAYLKTIMKFPKEAMSAQTN
jgi:putative transcriptional regulator